MGFYFFPTASMEKVPLWHTAKTPKVAIQWVPLRTTEAAYTSMIRSFFSHFWAYFSTFDNVIGRCLGKWSQNYLQRKIPRLYGILPNFEVHLHVSRTFKVLLYYWRIKIFFVGNWLEGGIFGIDKPKYIYLFI